MSAHLVSVEKLSNSATGMIKAYKEIRKELEKYDKNLDLKKDGLSNKEEIVILTKADVIPMQGKSLRKIIDKEKNKFEKLGRKVFVLSLFDDKMVKEFSDNLMKIFKKKS